jgi:hypothetical protein
MRLTCANADESGFGRTEMDAPSKRSNPTPSALCDVSEHRAQVSRDIAQVQGVVATLPCWTNSR